MKKSARRFASTSPDGFETLFGIPPEAFGRGELAVRHGSRARFASLLGNAALRDMRGVRRMAAEYSQDIRRSSFPGGRLRWDRLDGDERAELRASRQCCYSFEYLDDHFRGARLVRRMVASAVGADEERIMCRGWLHTPGAGMPRHCDAVDVLVVQLFGTRWWRVERNSDPPSGVDDPVEIGECDDAGWDRAFTGSSTIIRMRAGSALFVPHGWWHQTRSDALSYSITTSVRNATPETG